MARALEACAALLRDTHEDLAHTIDAAMDGAHRLEDGTTVAGWEPLPLAEMTERLEEAVYDHTVREMGLTDEPNAVERLRARIDADPQRGTQVDQLKEQMRAEMEVEVREDDLLGLLITGEHEVCDAVLDDSGREFLAQTARAAYTEIRRLRALVGEDGR